LFFFSRDHTRGSYLFLFLFPGVWCSFEVLGVLCRMFSSLLP
jgi:hypothetical protein